MWIKYVRHSTIDFKNNLMKGNLILQSSKQHREVDFFLFLIDIFAKKHKKVKFLLFWLEENWFDGKAELPSLNFNVNNLNSGQENTGVKSKTENNKKVELIFRS